jgi:hypothetical protein
MLNWYGARLARTHCIRYVSVNVSLVTRPYGSKLTRAFSHNLGKQSRGANLTCVFCRSPWPVVGGNAKTITSEGYLNLASIAGMSGVRDSTTCNIAYDLMLPQYSHESADYQGPRRGQRFYGYIDYDD